MGFYVVQRTMHAGLAFFKIRGSIKTRLFISGRGNGEHTTQKVGMALVFLYGADQLANYYELAA